MRKHVWFVKNIWVTQMTLSCVGHCNLYLCIRQQMSDGLLQEHLTYAWNRVDFCILSVIGCRTIWEVLFPDSLRRESEKRRLLPNCNRMYCKFYYFLNGLTLCITQWFSSVNLELRSHWEAHSRPRRFDGERSRSFARPKIDTGCD